MIKLLRKARTDREGFTLAETLVVIVILVALAAISVPIFLNQQEKAQDAATQSTVASLASGLATSLHSDANSVMSGVNGGGVTDIELVSQTGTVQMNPDGSEVFASNVPMSWCVSKEAPISGKIFVLTSFTASVTGRNTPYPAQSNCSSAIDQPASAPSDPGDPGVPGPVTNFSAICQLGGNGYLGTPDGWTKYVNAVNDRFGGDEAAARAGGVEFPARLSDFETYVYLSWDLPEYAATSPVVSWDTYALATGWDPNDPVYRNPPDAGGLPGPDFQIDYQDPGFTNGIAIIPHFADGTVGQPEFHRWTTEIDRTLANPAGCNVVPL